ncbi:MAG: hypothetical protein AAF598_14160, partial [Bacteroidota bacterium]
MKQPNLLLPLMLLFICSLTYGQVGINADNSAPASSAMLDVKSPDKGILIPRMDSTSRKNITTPAEGLMVYDTTTNSFWYYDMIWNELGNRTGLVSPSQLVPQLPSMPDLSCINVAGSVTTPASGFDFARSGNYAYILDTINNSFEIVNYSDPQNPVVTSPVFAGFNPLGIVKSGNNAYVGFPGMIKSFDVGFTEFPGEISQRSIAGTWSELAISGNNLYIGDLNTNILKVIDATFPNGLWQLGTYTSPNPFDCIGAAGNFIYLGMSAEMFVALDATVPSNISPSTPIPLGFSPKEIQTSGGFAYVIGSSNSGGYLSILDISNPNPILTATLNVGPSPIALSVSGNIAYVTDDFTSRLSLIDITTPSAPSVITSISIGTPVIDLDVSGNFAYFFNSSSREFTIVDLNPCPTFVGIDPATGTFTTNTGDDLGDHTATRNIQLNSNFISNNGSSNGIIIVNQGNVGIGVTNPASKLNVRETVTIGNFLGTSSFPSESLLVQGRIGIGASNPTSRLDVR